MTETEKIALVQTYFDGALSEALVTAYLQDAQAALLGRRYPFSDTSALTVPPQYERLQCRLAARYAAKNGAEGETSHDENGINRAYASANDEDLLMEVVPLAQVIK